MNRNPETENRNQQPEFPKPQTRYFLVITDGTDEIFAPWFAYGSTRLELISSAFDTDDRQYTYEYLNEILDHEPTENEIDDHLLGTNNFLEITMPGYNHDEYREIARHLIHNVLTESQIPTNQSLISVLESKFVVGSSIVWTPYEPTITNLWNDLKYRFPEEPWIQTLDTFIKFVSFVIRRSKITWNELTHEQWQHINDLIVLKNDPDEFDPAGL